MKETRRCATCGRFRQYDESDRYCMVCGNEGIDRACACGRSFDYALDEAGDLFCPGCGRALRGRSDDFE